MIPRCELLLRWPHTDKPHVCLEHGIDLIGAKGCPFITLYIPDAGEQFIPHANLYSYRNTVRNSPTFVITVCFRATWTFMLHCAYNYKNIPKPAICCINLPGAGTQTLSTGVSSPNSKSSVLSPTGWSFDTSSTCHIFESYLFGMSVSKLHALYASIMTVGL